MKDILCRKLRLFHVSGDILYPARVKDRDTGQLAFRVAKGGNTKSDSTPVMDEDDMIRKVTRQGYRVRARTEKPPTQGGRSGLYAIDERAIRSWELIENGEVNE